MRNLPNFTVLEGGQKLDIEKAERHFISAYVTDTRLMGVLAVYAHWHLHATEEQAAENSAVWGDLHQFFYIDCEETGLETYYEVRTSDSEEVEDMEQTLIGGLGASRLDLGEEELRRLLCHYKAFNEARGLPLPPEASRFRFLFTPNMTPGPGQITELMKKLCPPIVSDEQLINYFLMRCFGRDHEGASWLAQSGVDVTLYDRYIRASFCRNIIDLKTTGEDGTSVYLCDSLVEEDGHYDQIISRVETKDRRITGLEHCSTRRISDGEAALMLKKSEYITVYDILLSEEELEDNLGEFSIGFHTTMSHCENGRLFMAFRPNNAHVDSREFLLSNDVRGIYFLSDCGQLILAAYRLEDIRFLERQVYRSVLAPYLLATARLEFREPVLYEFMHSDIDTFESYLEMIRLDED